MIDPAVNDLRPLPREQTNSKYYEHLWRTIKQQAANGVPLCIACPPNSAQRIERAIRKRKGKDIAYKVRYPAVTLRVERTEDGLKFLLFHPIPL